MNSKDTTKITNIIVLRFNYPEMEDQCVKQIINCTDTSKTPYNLIVYDNFPEKGGVAYGWNKTIKALDSDYICLVNSDAIVEEGWLEKLIENLEDPKVGAVGPITNKCGTHQTGFSKSEKNDNKVKCKTLSGFCLLFKRKLWEEEPFDENYRIYAEETDFLNQAVKRGWQLVTDYRVHVFHHGAATMTKLHKDGVFDVEAEKRKSQKRYNEKGR